MCVAACVFVCTTGECVVFACVYTPVRAFARVYNEKTERETTT